jgi:hypothetical protein
VRLPTRIPSGQKKIQYWKKNGQKKLDVQEYPYEAPLLVYNREMDQLVEINTITRAVKEDDFGACADEGKMKSNDESKALCHKHQA